MANTTVRAAKVVDHHGKCRDCGAQLARPETIITYWNYVSADGMSGKRISEKGISKIDVNAGICEACQKKRLRAELEKKRTAIQKNDDFGPGCAPVALFAVGVFAFTLALILKATRTDGYGNPMPILTTWFYIWAGLDAACILGLIVAIPRMNRLAKAKEATLGDDLKLSDEALFAKYGVKDGVPYMKWAWSDFMVNQSKQRKGGLVYASELLEMGSAEEVARQLSQPEDLALDLYHAAKEYSPRG